MKKNSISKYCKIATVLLIDAIPIIATIRVTTADNVDSDFLGLGLVIMCFFFLIFNGLAFIIYHLTKLISKLWLRDILFYFLLFLCLFSPLIILWVKQMLQ